MSEFSGETLFQLLPAIYRTRDATQGYPLRALLGLLETQVSGIERDIAKLYDNWFIETCDEWVVPYIGDLIDVRQLRPIAVDAAETSLFTQRGYVANTLGFRRRKGTRALLEKLAQGVAGWPCVAVELFQLVSTTQHVNHVRPANRRTVDVRDPGPLELLYGPFDAATHTLEVRRAVGERGKYNIPSIGLFLWRLQAMALEEVDAVADAGGAERFRLNPLGADTVLFDRQETSSSFSQQNREAGMPGPLRPRAVWADLEAVRQTLAETGKTPPSAYFSKDPVVVIRTDAGVVPYEQIAICDLADWQLPAATRSYARSDGSSVDLPIAVALDPRTGRITFPQGTEPGEVHASYSYGFAGPIGGGTFERTLAPVANRKAYSVTGGGGGLDAVLAQWATDKPTSAVVQITDSRTYQLAAPLIVPAGLALEIRAAGEQRPLIETATPATEWLIEVDTETELELGGLAITAGLEITAKGDASLVLTDTTLVPGRALTSAGDPVLPGAASVTATEDGGRLTVTITRSIVGAVRLPLEDASTTKVTESTLVIRDSIIDGTGGADPAIIADSATLDRCTVFGTTELTALARASECIFTEPVTVARTQEGCVRFSFVPDGSKVPRAYRCQPRFALKDVADPSEQAAIVARIVPEFTSRRYIDAGYAQLLHRCAAEIRTGAEDESDMGVFQFLHQPQREANLRAAVDEYLRFGLDAGLFLVT